MFSTTGIITLSEIYKYCKNLKLRIELLVWVIL